MVKSDMLPIGSTELGTQDKAPKLSPYADQTVERVLAHHYLQIYQLPNGHELGQKVKEIARDWNDDKQIELFQNSFAALAKIAEEKGDQKSKAEMEGQLLEVTHKLGTAKKFKAELRQGGLLGQMVGAELLNKCNYDSSLLTEPLVLVGGQFVLDFLNAEHEADLNRLQSPNTTDEQREQFKPFIDGTVAAAEEMTRYLEKVKQLQSQPQVK